MSTTTTGAASAAATDAAVPTAEGFWAHLYHEAANLWHKLVNQGEDLATFVNSHPEIAGPVQSLEASFPPQVREGIIVAEEVANAVRGMNAHVTVATSGSGATGVGSTGSDSVGSASGAAASLDAPTPAASALPGSGSTSSGSGA